MQLKSIYRLNVTAIALLGFGLVAIFGSFPCGAFSVALGQAMFILGWIAGSACLLLSFVIDRVKCPHCGQPFHRPAYTHWLARHFAKTQPRWTCAHCGYGAKSKAES